MPYLYQRKVQPFSGPNKMSGDCRTLGMRLVRMPNQNIDQNARETVVTMALICSSCHTKPGTSLT